MDSRWKHALVRSKDRDDNVPSLDYGRERRYLFWPKQKFTAVAWIVRRGPREATRCSLASRPFRFSPMCVGGNKRNAVVGGGFTLSCGRGQRAAAAVDGLKMPIAAIAEIAGTARLDGRTPISRWKSARGEEMGRGITSSARARAQGPMKTLVTSAIPNRWRGWVLEFKEAGDRLVVLLFRGVTNCDAGFKKMHELELDIFRQIVWVDWRRQLNHVESLKKL